MSRISSIFSSLLLWFITGVPGPAGDALRRWYYRDRLSYLGSGARIDVGVHIVNPEYVSIGENTLIDKYVLINAGPPTVGKRHVFQVQNPNFGYEEGTVIIGPNTHVAPYVVINGHGGVHIEGDSGVASGSYIYSLSHHHRDLVDSNDERLYIFSPQVSQDWQALISGPVVIRQRGALTLNCVMLPGSTIGCDAWVTMGSTVSGEIPEGCIASGSPAVPVRWRPGYKASS
jgi:acetyltransferase-like isoleucine patch superfamily enzyme